MKAKCTLEIPDDSHILRITHENGRLVGEILFHGPLDKVLLNCDQMRPQLTGRPNHYRAECFGLAGYETIDFESERVVDK